MEFLEEPNLLNLHIFDPFETDNQCSSLLSENYEVFFDLLEKMMTIKKNFFIGLLPPSDFVIYLKF